MLRKIAAVLAVVVVISMLVGPLAKFDNGAPASVSAPGGDTLVARVNQAGTSGGGNPAVDGVKASAAGKPVDQPNFKDKQRMIARQRLLEAGQTAEATALAQTGTDRVLVVLVEFAGTDVFTWTAPITPTDPATGSQWDPLGMADAAEDTGTLGDCSLIITQTQTFTYTGPLHNGLPRPLSADDRSGDSIWTEDFNPQWFTDFMFGNGVVISYTRQDSSQVYYDFMGRSVKNFYEDLSSSTYTITGDVIGWLGVPHSTWYYDADQCPGARSGGGARGGQIPGAGSTRDLIRHSLDAVNAISNTIPGFNWANYDMDGDGIIDRLWIVHAGYGEEDGTELLNRMPLNGTFYGEAAVWSHSSAVTPPYSVTQNIAASAYIIMPENGGVGVFAHEYAHNLGADDLYSYGEAETSAGFWTTMADDWTGSPIGFIPPSMDPWHLDNWGWLNPMVIADTTKVYTVTLGQASDFSTNTATGPAYRAAKIQLESGQLPLAVQPWSGTHYWWGGNEDLNNSMMTNHAPIALPASSPITLTFETVYGIESEWDFMWIQVSADAGATWNTLTNTNTTCTHVVGWVGGLNGFPDDLCGAGIGGFTDYNADFPDPTLETFDLSAYAGQNVLLRFWYMTDWGTTYEGPFVDNVTVRAGTSTVFSDGAETGGTAWDYEAPWMVSSGMMPFTHNYYVQWRNTHANGGYDSSLGAEGWRFSPANTGMVVWYNNNFYNTNDVFNVDSGLNVLNDYPGFGPKGRMLVVDSHPEPYREPQMVAAGYNNEGGNVAHRSQMRDAPFTLQNTVDFTYTTVYAFPFTTTLFTNHFNGRPAVSEFNDAYGYYPGAEYISRGPGYSPPSMRWVTKQWDSSVVVPSKSFYGIKAPGYDGTHTGSTANEFRYDCASTAAGLLGCYWFGSGNGLGYDGGNGNPADVNGQYGWHVQVIEEAADHTWATVRIWNEQPHEVSYTPAALPLPGTHNITYQIKLNNAGTVTQTRQFTYTLDPALTFVSHSWVGGVDLAPTFSYSTTVNPGQTLTFTLVASVTVSANQAQTTVTTSVMHDDLMNPVETTNLVTLLGMYRIHLPLIRR